MKTNHDPATDDPRLPPLYPKHLVPSHKLQGVSTPFGFIGSEGKRRARELFEQGLIERQSDGKFAVYRAKPKGVERLVVDVGAGRPPKIVEQARW